MADWNGFPCDDDTMPVPPCPGRHLPPRVASVGPRAEPHPGPGAEPGVVAAPDAADDRSRLRGFLARDWFPWARLSPAEREVVLDFTLRFCASTEFWFSPGLEDHEALSWLVGAAAALVGGAQPTGCFNDVRWVYLLDDNVLDDDRSGDALGLSTIRLNVHDLLNESGTCIPGQQVAVHEFAHILDVMFGLSGGSQGLREGLDLHLAHCRDGVEDLFPEAVADALLDDNAGVEFFAYASEWFFTDPLALRDFYPPLYADLVAIYGLQPL